MMNTRNHNERELRVPGGDVRPAPLRDRVLTQTPEPLTRFEEAFADVKADDRIKWDQSVLRQDLVMKDGALAARSSCGEEEGTALRPTRWALGQMCVRLGVPAPYFAVCPPVLQDMQANYWLQHGPSAVARRGERFENGFVIFP